MRKNKLTKTLLTSALALTLAVSALILGSSKPAFAAETTTAAETKAAAEDATVVPAPADGGTAKYVFLFIGDGMSHVQVNLAQAFRGTDIKGDIKNSLMSFSEFPITGVATTQDSTSFCPDSASTATSISAGVKTHSGVIGLTADLKTKVKTVAQYAKDAGMKVGVISSVTLNHATPAAFYASNESRNNYYNIGEQMAASGFDYFAGGSLKDRTDKEKDKTDLYEVLKNAGYTVTETKEDFDKLSAGTKAYAVSNALCIFSRISYVSISSIHREESKVRNNISSRKRFALKVLCFGSLNIDKVYDVEEFVKEGQTISSLSFNVYPGGKGLNQSIALARSGLDVFHAGIIGSSDAKLIFETLKESNVDARFIKVLDVESGHAMIQRKTDGQNCIIVHGGATFDSPRKKSDGIVTVIVNGLPAMLDGTLTGILAGKNIKRGQ